MSFVSTGIAFLAANLCSTLLHSIPWASFFLFTPFFGFHVYEIKQKEVCQRIQRRIRYSSQRSEQDKPLGYSIGKWFLAHIYIESDHQGDIYNIWLFSTNKMFVSLTQEESLSIVNTNLTGTSNNVNPGLKSEQKNLTIYTRSGTFFSIWFKKRVVPFSAFTPRQEQKEILESIQSDFKKRSYSVCYIHGPPGSGKSMLGAFLALELKGVLCNTLKPWNPSDTLAELYAEAEVSAENPLVLVFDEVDSVLVHIHEGIPSHKNLPIAIQNKPGWNHFLDEIARGMFPYLVLLLTSNQPPEWVNGLDPSYLREGRVNKVFELKGAAPLLKN
jgi:hypothetical protein